MRRRVLLRDLVALSACDGFNQFCRPKLFLISCISRTLDVSSSYSASALRAVRHCENNKLNLTLGFSPQLCGSLDIVALFSLCAHFL